MPPSQVTLLAALALALASIPAAAAGGFQKDTPAAAADRITSLPGLSPFPTDYSMYSGYVTVNAASQRRLFYWMVTSKADAANAPVVMWLNGGPGCSSLNGLLEQHGPFRPDAHGNLQPNDATWTSVANMLYLESPAGVGFSYSKNTSDYTVGDERTADDTYLFMQGFYQKFPALAANDFWITGESYGGHYIPNAAARIVRGNEEKQGAHINLKGFMVGNAWTDSTIDNRGAVDFWFQHGMVSAATYSGIVASCNFSDVGPLKARRGGNDACDSFCDKAFKEMGAVNIYDVYEDVCESDTSRSNTRTSSDATAAQRLVRMMGRMSPLFAPLSASPSPPCIDDYTTKWVNQEAVYQAMHVEINYPWTGCSDFISYSYSDLLASMLPVYNSLLTKNISIMVYSGDVDAIVPFTGTRAWLDKLALPIAAPFRPWFLGKQTGGYVTKYNGLTFATVRNAGDHPPNCAALSTQAFTGHMVGGTQPERALAMFERFLNGEEL